MSDVIGSRALCSVCDEVIICLNGRAWKHQGATRRDHPATLGERMTRHKVEMRLDLDAIEKRISLAHEKVRALCLGDERWTMRIPADENYDHDLIIGAALRDADELLLAVRSLLGRLLMDEIEKALRTAGIYRGPLPKWLIAALRICGYTVRVLGGQGDLFDVEVKQNE